MAGESGGADAEVVGDGEAGEEVTFGSVVSLVVGGAGALMGRHAAPGKAGLAAVRAISRPMAPVESAAGLA